MATTFSVVSCQEVHGSRVEAFGLTAASAEVKLRFSWADRYDLANDLNRNGGRQYPYSSQLYVSNVSIAPEPGQYTEDGQGMTYEYGIASVTYSTPNILGGGGNNDPEDPIELASESFEFTTKFLTLDHELFNWESPATEAGNLVPDEAPGMMLKGCIFYRTIYQVRVIPSNILTVGGTVNDRKYKSRILGVTFETGTLLCNPPKISRSYTTEGVSAWTLTCSWEHNPHEWNAFYRASTGTWSYMYKKNGDQMLLYRLADQRPFLPG